MIQTLYDWVWKLAGYLIFATALLQIIPGERERKYIQFFTGLVLVLMIAAPVLGWWSSDDFFEQLKAQCESIEEKVLTIDDFVPEDTWEEEEEEKGEENHAIQVEKIRIGHEGETP